MENRIRVAVVGEHPIVRFGIRQLLAVEADIQIVSDSTFNLQSVQALIGTPLDMIVLDSLLSNPRCWEAIRALRRSFPTTRMILLVNWTDKHQFARALRLGCSGLVFKEAQSHDLLTCIREVSAGRLWLHSHGATKTHVASHNNRKRASTGKVGEPGSGYRRPFSKRERELLALIAQGYTNAEIAGKLFISTRTVNNHLHRMYKVIGVKDRFELARRAVEVEYV